MTMTEREVGTNEAAKLVGVAPDVLRKWKARGLLTLAPQGVSGQGRSVECHWSQEAIEEAKKVSVTRQRGHPRTRTK